MFVLTLLCVRFKRCPPYPGIDRYGEKFRVNAISPGFFIAEQNRALLTNEDGSLTSRGETIINNTPMKRFGKYVCNVAGSLFCARSPAPELASSRAIRPTLATSQVLSFCEQIHLQRQHKQQLIHHTPSCGQRCDASYFLFVVVDLL